jgi:hypothetical protein
MNPYESPKTSFMVGVPSVAQTQMLQHDDEGAEGEDKWRLGGGGKHALRQVEDRSAG